jgi:hypothetical protein
MSSPFWMKIAACLGDTLDERGLNRNALRSDLLTDPLAHVGGYREEFAQLDLDGLVEYAIHELRRQSPIFNGCHIAHGRS